MVEQDLADILVGPYKNPEREARFSFAARGFYRDYMVFYVRRGNKQQWDGNLESLQGQKIAVINGWVYGPRFEGARAILKPQIANTLANGLNMLNAGRVDYLAANLRNAEALIKRMGLGAEFSLSDQLIDSQDGYLAFCKKSSCDQLRRQFDQAYERFIDSGDFAKMAHTYGVRTP
jgi:polar amino acid transport system substrate-binding protein